VKLITYISIISIPISEQVPSAKSFGETLEDGFNTDANRDWDLSYHLLVPRTEAGSGKTPTKFHHVLDMKNTSQVFLYVETRSSSPQGTVQVELVSTPRESKEVYLNMLKSKLALIWSPKQVTMVANGGWCKISDMTVRFGDLKHMGNVPPKAVVAAITLSFEQQDPEKMSDEEEKWLRHQISAVWTKLDIKGARESWGFGDQTAIIQTWCEMLRAR